MIERAGTNLNNVLERLKPEWRDNIKVINQVSWPPSGLDCYCTRKFAHTGLYSKYETTSVVRRSGTSCEIT